MFLQRYIKGNNYEVILHRGMIVLIEMIFNNGVGRRI